MATKAARRNPTPKRKHTKVKSDNMHTKTTVTELKDEETPRAVEPVPQTTDIPNK